MKERYVHEGDHNIHKYRFTGNLIVLSGQSLDMEGEELIETEVHWLVKMTNGHFMHLPKDLYARDGHNPVSDDEPSEEKEQE